VEAMTEQKPNMKFSPGSEMEGNLTVDLTKGFTWAAAMEISSGHPASKRSILTICDSDAEPLFELFMKKGDLLLAVGGAGGVRIQIDEKELASALDKWSIIYAFAKLVNGKLSMELSVNDEKIAKGVKKYSGRTKSESQVVGDPGGDRGATFKMGEVVLIDRRVPKVERKSLFAYLNERWLGAPK
jgi:hypothetical protein